MCAEGDGDGEDILAKGERWNQMPHDGNDARWERRKCGAGMDSQGSDGGCDRVMPWIWF